MVNGRTWLLIDAPGVCHQAYHAIPELDWRGVRTEVLYGMFNTVRSLSRQFPAATLCFAFDSKHSKRREAYPPYKTNRKPKNVEDQHKRDELYKQMDVLRRELLPNIGFANVFCQKGIEADDLIAVACKGIGKQDTAFIASSDKDLFQLLAPNVIFWSLRRKETYTDKAFKREWGIEPSQWAYAKAIAGDPGDNLPGIPGVGLKTAAKFLNGTLGKHLQAHGKIEADIKYQTANIPLMRLPFKGTKPLTLEWQPGWDRKAWNKIMRAHGLKTLVDGF